VQIHRQVEALAAEPAAQTDVVNETAPPAAMGHGDDVGQPRILRHDRRGGGFDEVDEPSRGKAAGQRANHRCREDHVADQAKTHEEDVQGRVSARSWLRRGA
jgi:hypothetical protein